MRIIYCAMLYAKTVGQEPKPPDRYRQTFGLVFSRHPVSPSWSAAHCWIRILRSVLCASHGIAAGLKGSTFDVILTFKASRTLLRLGFSPAGSDVLSASFRTLFWMERSLFTAEPLIFKCDALFITCYTPSITAAVSLNASYADLCWLAFACLACTLAAQIWGDMPLLQIVLSPSDSISATCTVKNRMMLWTSAEVTPK